MDEQQKLRTEHFQFPITPFLQKRLNSLSKAANHEGEKIVRWTDIILAGLSKLEPQDLVRVRHDREIFLRERQQEAVHGQPL